MRRISYARLTVYCLLFAISLGFIAYGWMARELDRAYREFSTGELEAAMERYARVERPLRLFPWLTRIFPAEYEQASLNQVAILYRQQRSAEALDKLEEIPALSPAQIERAAYAYWMGNVLFRQAAETKDPEIAAKALKSALLEYQRGLAAQPDDWDLKFNYELLRSTLSQPNRDAKAQERKVKSIIDKMRPAEPAQQQVAPEKRG
jgi:hypothetical protein